MENWNYFNYFTEIETYFWKKRGASLLVSPLDWAIMEAWQKAGVPLEAVLKGIDKAVESYQRSRRGARKSLKSLAYCTDAVLEAAEELQEAAAGSAPKNGAGKTKEPFTREELSEYFKKNAQRIKDVEQNPATTGTEFARRLTEIVDSLLKCELIVVAPAALDLEDLERRLTVLDDKVQALLLSQASEETMLKIRREMDGQLAMYRRKMKAEQLAQVEKQYMQKRLLEIYGLPRLSLYYIC
ncbi:MAG TPA: hypothetical protein VJN93_04510 [Candidatus Acidoferrum sp.]|nr:hypothetical protein [Candidatus Acidoferrum sp.]